MGLKVGWTKTKQLHCIIYNKYDFHGLFLLCYFELRVQTLFLKTQSKQDSISGLPGFGFPEILGQSPELQHEATRPPVEGSTV